MDTMCEAFGDNIKYKWTPDSTALLVSVWSDRQVQKQLEYAPKPQLIWENVARYMRKKGYNVTAKQCRSRMKQVLVCYREAKRAGTRSGVEQYYETIDQVLRNKRLEQTNVNGVDTVDAAVNIKSPPKDIKTNKNLQMRLKTQEPVESLFRTDALSPTWTMSRENEHPDSPESNETIIARPYRVFSPTRDVAINTGEQFIQIGSQAVQTNLEPIREKYQQNLLAQYQYGDIPYQNTVQNVQNQIIQENMQQYQNIQQNRGWNYLPQQNLQINNQGFQQNLHNQRLSNGMTQNNVSIHPNMENIMRHQNRLHREILTNNRAMPQEPRKVVFGQNLAATYKQYKDTVPRLVNIGDDKPNGSLSPDYSPDVSQNLNDAFCQSKSDNKTHNLNETYTRANQFGNPVLISNADVTVVTNNATCNDESMLLEFLLDSPTPSENDGKLKDSAVNTDIVPNAPFRKKKAQKLEQLVLSAINSQNEVVNKILAAQNDMVTRFLDVDRDRQSRLENRLDHLLNVVHTSVLKNGEVDGETSAPPPPPLPEPVITSLVPPPKPGMIPPKLDLVPPKPCRVPCTMPNSNIELINQNPVLTRPGIVSPIASPGRKLGTIWTKLGPVSQSPFVKAQQRLGFQPIFSSNIRTQSSAERRIAKEITDLNTDKRAIIYETAKLLEMERYLEEKIENARLETRMGQTLSARRKLFTQREPTPIIILTAAFLEAECLAYEQDPPYYGTWNLRKEKLKCMREDNLMAGQGESYERYVSARRDYLGYEPRDTSTPAKPLLIRNNNKDEAYTGVAKQTIQQLARLVMNSARWRDPALQNQQQNSVRPIVATRKINQNAPDVEYNATFTAPKANAPPLIPEEQSQEFIKGSNMMQKNIGNGNGKEIASDDKLLQNELHGQTKFPMGFTTTMLTKNDPRITAPRHINNDRVVKLGFENLSDNKNNVRFMDDALTELQRMYNERQAVIEATNEILPVVANNGNNVLSAQYCNMIERYVSDIIQKKTARENRNKDTDSDNDDEFLDTTASMNPTCVVRRGSLTSNGTASTETTQSVKSSKAIANNCRIS